MWGVLQAQRHSHHRQSLGLIKWESHVQAAGDAAEAQAPVATSVAALGRPEDGYRVAKRLGAAAVQLREQLLQLLKGARFWEKDFDWLQVSAPSCPSRPLKRDVFAPCCSISFQEPIVPACFPPMVSLKEPSRNNDELFTF